ncbi:SCO7613 C-terminal domain-containing membrane protein [Streptomyces yaizuensis]|uniref:Integral membrane protein n=1 Tax=Streptomyces yaizuensis TaxID=2989713 RepID=A0ABQ5P170_9ACTN|nr:hypothetical protein [Streptomyces sp. YSPA8]GLF96349.1 hypothetical protein SYYSPA8_18650 [Streptomyces sp. YSPA8]
MKNGTTPGALAEELARVDRELTHLDAHRQRLLAHRSRLLAALHPPATAPARSRADSTGAAAGTSAETSTARTQNTLLTLGGVLLAVAAIAFTLVGWGQLGIGGRSAVLAGVTAAALGAPPFLLRRGLRSTAESVAALGLALTVLDAYALYLVALTDLDGLACAAGAATVLTALWAAYGRAVPRLRVPLPAAVAMAQFPLPAWALYAGPGRALDWALLLTAAGSAGLAARAGRRTVRAVAAAGAAVTGGGVLLLGGLDALAATAPAGALGPAALLAAAAVVALAAARGTDRAGLALAVIAGLALVTGAGSAVRTALPDGWAVPGYPLVATVLLAAVALPGVRERLARPLRAGLALAAAGTHLAALLSALPPLLLALTGPLRTSQPWTGPGPDARTVLGSDVPGAPPAAATAILLLAALTLVLTTLRPALSRDVRRAWARTTARFGSPAAEGVGSGPWTKLAPAAGLRQYPGTAPERPAPGTSGLATSGLAAEHTPPATGNATAPTVERRNTVAARTGETPAGPEGPVPGDRSTGTPPGHGAEDPVPGTPHHGPVGTTRATAPASATGAADARRPSATAGGSDPAPTRTTRTRRTPMGSGESATAPTGRPHQGRDHAAPTGGVRDTGDVHAEEATPGGTSTLRPAGPESPVPGGTGTHTPAGPEQTGKTSPGAPDDRGRSGAGLVGAGVLGWGALFLVPAAVGAGFVATLAVQVLVTLAALAVAVRPAWPAGTATAAGGVAVGCALGGGASTALLALATRPATFTVLGVLVAALLAGAVASRVGGAVRSAVVCGAVASGTALLLAVGPAAGWEAHRAGPLVLVVPVLVALVAGRLGDHPVSVPLEVSGAVAGLVAAQAALAHPPTFALVCALGGVIAAGTALRPERRRIAAPVAGALFLLATWVRLAAWEVTVPEAYALPAAVPALVVGLVWRRRVPGTSSWRAYGPGLGLGLVPGLAALPGDGGWTRPLLLGLAALAVTLVGARRRLQAPLVLGGAVLALVAGNELAPYVVQAVDALPRWLAPALAGLLLLAVGATYEQRLREARRLRGALGRMR